MKPGKLLELLSRALAGQRRMRMEFSTRLRPGRVEKAGRFCCWVDHSPAAADSVMAVLRQLGAPVDVAAQPLAVADGQGIRHGIAIGGGALRYYRQARLPNTLADDYQAWRWCPGGAVAETRRYVAYYPPETPDGQRPLDLVPESLRDSFARLLSEPRFVQASAFWLRLGADGQPDQLDLAFPWSPCADTLPGLLDLGELLKLPAGSGWRRLPVRHVAVSLVGDEPEITLYSSAPWQGAWPAGEAELRRGVKAQSLIMNRHAETQLYAAFPPAKQPDGADVGAFYDGSIDLWRRVLGPDLHYHFGIFDDPQAKPDSEAMQVAQRRAVTELYPLLPQGKRIYDVGCGWGGPMSMWVRDLGCPTLGLTVSRDQYRHIGSLGLPVRLGNAEETLPPGFFDCAVLLESLCHMRDKERLLRGLRAFSHRLVMRVHCQDAAPPGVVFGGTMHMISSGDLRQLLERTGWTIRHWQNRRFDTLPNFQGWSNALRSVPPTGNAHIEELRKWAARGERIISDWGHNNPLIEVMAT
ncbi:MAG: class I SAM-dependent methyltransferase [Alphaproteobacteria bacterium]|nr:class I SAM-dependent methyltransferase [Alphaproteobacteria bacterium]